MIQAKKKKINKETSELNDTIEQPDLIDIYRIFHPTATENTIVSAAHVTFSKIDHILEQKASHKNTRKSNLKGGVQDDMTGTYACKSWFLFFSFF
jgi:hypothetical protein